MDSAMLNSSKSSSTECYSDKDTSDFMLDNNSPLLMSSDFKLNFLPKVSNKKPSKSFSIAKNFKLSLDMDKITPKKVSSLSKKFSNIIFEDEYIAGLQDFFPAEFSNTYEILQFISKGCQGNVYKVQNKQTEEVFAAKVYHVSDQEEKLLIEQEFNIMKNLKQTQFVKPINLLRNDEFDIIILIEEFFEGIQLLESLQNDQIQFSNDQINDIAKQLLSAIAFLHKQNIVHRDIKLQNILIDFYTNKIKLIDFGVAREFACNNFSDFMCSPNGDFFFQAPEMQVISNEFNLSYNEKIDEFGVGLVILSLLENKMVQTKQIKKIFSNHKSKINEYNKLYNLCQKLLLKDFIQRTSAEQALNEFFCC